MLISFIFPLLLCYVLAAQETVPFMTDGFEAPVVSYSAGKKAVCVSGRVPVSVSAINTKLLFSQPEDQPDATERIQELVQAGSTLVARSNGGTSTITDTFGISVRLCYPANLAAAAKVSTIQILVHGVGLDRTYWDITPGLSYVDASADAGYATLAYDRLGVGQSDHPDPIQVVQAYTDVEIEHGIVQILRTGKVAKKVFKKIIGVGHSYGSIVMVGTTSKYPNDLDAVVLTGFSSTLVNLPSTILANNPSVAKLNDPARFGNLPTGYLVHASPIAIQLPFFRYPFFDQAVFDAQYAQKQTYTFGQLLTIGGILTPSQNFTGPIDVVLGQNDFPFCLGECTIPSDQAAAVKPAFYPAASGGSQSLIIPNCGHNINAHTAAPQEFAQVVAFLKANNL